MVFETTNFRPITHHPQIKNIIFDLGGVIINLDQQATINAFNTLSAIPFEELYSQKEQSVIFDKFDKGHVSDFEFFTELRRQLKYQGPDEELLRAWNAMLLDIPKRRLEMLVKLRLDYKTYLLSNTNETHIREIERELYLQHGVKNFSDYFERIYYSCRHGMRKPDAEIFHHLLKKEKLKPEETIFIDDSIQHVQGAGACGIRAYLLPKGMEVEDLLKELRIL